MHFAGQQRVPAGPVIFGDKEDQEQQDGKDQYFDFGGAHAASNQCISVRLQQGSSLRCLLAVVVDSRPAGLPTPRRMPSCPTTKAPVTRSPAVHSGTSGVPTRRFARAGNNVGLDRDCARRGRSDSLSSTSMPNSPLMQNADVNATLADGTGKLRI